MHLRHWISAACLVAGLVAARAALHAQEQATVYLSVMDQQGAPVLGVEPSDIMVSTALSPAEPGGLPVIDANGGQTAEIAKAVQELTRGNYVPITGSGTSALSSKILPELAQQITLRNTRQMMQHRIVMERPAGARGPMKNFAFALLNHPGAQFVVSADGNIGNSP